jgi:hypothetical protein
MSPWVASSAIAWQGVFTSSIVTGVAYMAAPVPGLVPVKVVELLLSTPWQRSMVTVTRIITVIDMAVKAGMAMKPRPGSNKDPTQKPIGAVVAVR